FYQPSNMVLFIAGHIQPDKLMDIIRDNQDKKSFVSMPLVTRGDYQEDKSVFCRREVKYMDVSASKVSIALKINDIPSNIQDRLNRELAFTILLDMLFSKSSDIREEWTLRELINDSFDVTFIQERDYSLFFMSSDTEKTNELEEVFHQFIKNMKDYSADPVIFERMKKKNIGMIIQAFNSPETIASLFSRYYFEGINAFDLISLINNLDIKEIRKISNLFDDDLTSTFLIIPEGKNID
ncbi:insulinase family protein, partial [Eggerthia catenaformis]